MHDACLRHGLHALPHLHTDERKTKAMLIKQETQEVESSEHPRMIAHAENVSTPAAECLGIDTVWADANWWNSKKSTLRLSQHVDACKFSCAMKKTGSRSSMS